MKSLLGKTCSIEHTYYNGGMYDDPLSLDWPVPDELEVVMDMSRMMASHDAEQLTPHRPNPRRASR